MTARKGALYSGNASKPFWNRIAAIPDEPAHTLAYLAGCALQGQEQRMLQMLDYIEKRDGEEQSR